MKPRVYLILALLVLPLAGVVYYFSAPGHTPAGQPPLADFDSGRFVRAFNQSTSQVRVVAMLSPT